MYQFIKVKVKHPRIKLPINYGWMLRIDSPFVLMAYEMEANLYSNAFADIVNLKDRGHYTNHIAASVHCLAQLSMNSVVVELGILRAKALECKIKLLREFGVIYVNKVGGCFPKGKRVKEYSEVVEKEKLLFPTDSKREIKFLQWPGGKHWYVKVDNIDVLVDGEQKWSTKKSAEKALKKWMDLKNIKKG